MRARIEQMLKDRSYRTPRVDNPVVAKNRIAQMKSYYESKFSERELASMPEYALLTTPRQPKENPMDNPRVVRIGGVIYKAPDVVPPELAEAHIRGVTGLTAPRQSLCGKMGAPAMASSCSSCKGSVSSSTIGYQMKPLSNDQIIDAMSSKIVKPNAVTNINGINYVKDDSGNVYVADWQFGQSGQRKQSYRKRKTGKKARSATQNYASKNTPPFSKPSSYRANMSEAEIQKIKEELIAKHTIELEKLSASGKIPPAPTAWGYKKKVDDLTTEEMQALKDAFIKEHTQTPVAFGKPVPTTSASGKIPPASTAWGYKKKIDDLTTEEMQSLRDEFIKEHMKTPPVVGGRMVSSTSLKFPSRVGESVPVPVKVVPSRVIVNGGQVYIPTTSNGDIIAARVVGARARKQKYKKIRKSGRNIARSKKKVIKNRK
jgi:hypothetical protein